MRKIYRHNIADKEIAISIGDLAEQAGGACLVMFGDTRVLASATCSKKPREGINFFPLSCEYEEKLYSVGKIPGGFIKREGRPSEKSVLTSRLIDRPLRPLFPEGFRNDVQVITTVLSVDQDYSPGIAAMIGSSVVLSISNIPFSGPTGAINVGYIDGNYIANPTNEEKRRSTIDLTVSGTKDAIMMVEAGANIVSEEIMLNAILFAHEEIKKICLFIEEIVADCNVEKLEYEVYSIDENVKLEVINKYKDSVIDAFKSPDKMEREKNLEDLRTIVINDLISEYPDKEKDILESFDEIMRDEVRRLIVHEKKRPDDRELDEIRSIWSEVGLLPRTHGSGLFTRGQTQVLTIATLGAISDAQVLDGIGEEESKRYMHQYNFPPYSVGDVRPLRSASRREIGHGALAERALEPVIPTEEAFPYTIRLVSEVLSSNGSSSQASVCGSTLALMDAGVPISEPVAGIAMGLIKDGDSVSILTDIQGLEDHLGDMDFKVAGTKDGITAIQMDIKIDGVDRAILEEALEKARKARLFILDKINETISEPRNELSQYAPRILTIVVHPDKVREIIGPGGKMINKIIDETGVKIDIEDATVFVSAIDLKSCEKAIDMINAIIKDVEVGDIYSGKVTKIMNFGAFVEIGNNKEGLVHISNIAKERINKVEDVLKLGDKFDVKVMEIDPQGRINLSRKALLKDEENK